MDIPRLTRRPRGLIVLAAIAVAPAVSYAQARGPQTASDSLALELAIYKVALTNGSETAHAATPPELVCVAGTRPKTDPSVSVIAALQENRALLVRPMSACKTDPLRGRSEPSLVVDTLTGKRGISISATEPVFEDDGTFTVETKYYQNGLSSGGWRCHGRRAGDQRWEITTCKMLWIS